MRSQHTLTALSSELVIEVLMLLDDRALRRAGDTCRLLASLEDFECERRSRRLVGDDAPGAATLAPSSGRCSSVAGGDRSESSQTTRSWRRTFNRLSVVDGVEVRNTENDARVETPSALTTHRALSEARAI